MGYDIHITRADSSDEAGDGKISMEDWLDYLKTDTEVMRDPDNGSSAFLFVAHPKAPQPLQWWRDELVTKNPDDPMIRKMIQIAEGLKAKVLGDDSERYVLDESGAVCRVDEE